MLVKTRIFEFYDRNYQSLVEVANAMEISVSQIYRVRAGKHNINQKFIVGTMKAFPGCKFDELFYLSPEVPTVTSHPRHHYSASEPAVKKEQRVKRKQPALEKSALAT